jgi:hypothetical protein
MKLYRFDTQKKAVIILGAGASRGASFIKGQKILPPLDKDFFEQLQRIPGDDKNLPHAQLLRWARKEFGPLLDISMESFFSQIQFLNDFHRELKIDRGNKVNRYAKILELFASVMVEVFQHGFCRGTLHEMRSCRHHEVLAKLLEQGDAVVSFNYDCLMDLALKSKSAKKWNAEYGYGFKISQGHKAWHTHAGKGRAAKELSILLLKMHGSLNWDRTVEKSVKLRSEPYNSTSVRVQNEVIPPVWNKDILHNDLYKKVWCEARTRLRKCNILIVIGYSVPETDLMSKSLIRVETQKLDYLIIANPSIDDRVKLKKLVAKAIRQDTKILEFDNIEQLAGYLNPRVLRVPSNTQHVTAMDSSI